MLEILIVNLWNPATPTSWRGSFLRSTTMAAPIRRGHGVFVDYSFSVRLANRIFRDISKFKNAGIYCCCCTLAKKRCNSCIWNALRSEVSTRKFQLQWQCSMSDTVTAANSRLQTGRRPVDDITVIILLLHTDFGSVWRTTALSYWNRASLQLIVLWSTNPHLPFQDVFPLPCRVYEQSLQQPFYQRQTWLTDLVNCKSSNQCLSHLLRLLHLVDCVTGRSIISGFELTGGFQVTTFELYQVCFK